MKKALNVLALISIANHVHKLTTLTDDHAGTMILLDCKDRLLDRADNLAHEEEKNSHPS